MAARPFIFDSNNPPLTEADAEALQKMMPRGIVHWADDLPQNLTVGGYYFEKKEDEKLLYPHTHAPLRFWFEKAKK